MTIVENETAEQLELDGVSDAAASESGISDEAIPEAPSAQNITYANETITPEKARELISAMAVQRREEKQAVETYANAIRKDAWMLNGLPIIFDEKGRVIDGFHRLAAVVESGKEIRTATARGVPGDVLHTVDQHRKRNFSGVLEGRGVKNTGTLVRLLGRMIRLENGIYHVNNKHIGWSRLDHVLKANPEFFDAVTQAENHKGNLLRSGVLNILFFMALRAGREADLKLFLEDFEPEKDPEHTKFRSTRKLRMEITSHRSRARRAAKAGANAAGLTEDEEIGGAIMAFNDAFNGDKLRDSYLWSPDLETNEVPDERKGKIERVKAEKRAIAAEKRRLRKEGRKDEIDNIDVSKLKVNFTMPTKLVPVPNHGMPVMDGYPGLVEGKIQDLAAGDDYDSQMAEELAEAKANANGEPVYRSLILSPDMAKRLLRFNTRNRKIQPNHVKMIASDIKDGNWMMNGQPICFTANPFQAGADPSNTRLLNGQHRLQACIMANEPIEIWLAFDVDEAAFATYDNHAKRSMLFQIEKETVFDERVMMAAAKFMWRVDNGFDVLAAKTPTTTQLSKTLEKHPMLFKVFSDARRLKDFGSAGVLTYVLARVKEERDDFYDDYFDVLESGTGIEKGNPFGPLRTEIVGAYKAKAKRADMLKLHLMAWEAYKEWRIAKDIAKGQ